MPLQIAATDDVATCRALRRTVFIEEQGVAEQDEIDDLDDEAVHLLAILDGTPVGSARLLLRGDMGKIGRVCVLADHRGRGIGSALTHAANDHFRKTPGLVAAKLSAQTHAVAFYERLGFTAHGAVFLDAGIPHLDMICPL